MSRDVYQYKLYKAYLNERLDDPAKGGGRGARARLSEAVGCQSAYTAQVLKGGADFSLEQAEAINEFFGHTEEEGEYFLLLVQFARAGAARLRSRFEKRIRAIQEDRANLKSRLKVGQQLQQADQSIYYSAWYYAAIHAIVSIPRFQRSDAIAEYLHLSPSRVSEALEFLVNAGILERLPHGRHKVGTTRIHLGADSPWVARHHSNWRLAAIRSLEKSGTDELHYSSVITVSDEDALRIREILIKTLETVKPIIRESPEERLQCLSMDFFKL